MIHLPGGRRWSPLVATATLAALLAACTSAGESPQPGSSTPSSSATATASEPASASPTPQSAAPSAEPTEIAPSSAAPDVTTVTIRSHSFGPPEISVAVGDVTFVNQDDDPHTVTEGENGAAAPDGRFDEFVGAGESVTITFAEPGDYQITCQFHAEMRLLVHVQ